MHAPLPQHLACVCCRQMLQRLAAYGVTAFAFCVLAESVPLFAATPYASGGLGMPSAQLAIPLAFGGVWLIGSALLLYPRVQSRLGNKRCAALHRLHSMGMAVVLFVLLARPTAHTRGAPVLQDAAQIHAMCVALRTFPFSQACMGMGFEAVCPVRIL